MFKKEKTQTCHGATRPLMVTCLPAGPVKPQIQDMHCYLTAVGVIHDSCHIGNIKLNCPQAGRKNIYFQYIKK